MADAQRPTRGSSKGTPKGRPAGRSGDRRERPTGRPPAPRSRPAAGPPARAERPAPRAPARDREEERDRGRRAPRPSAADERKPPRPPARGSGTGPRKPAAPAAAAGRHEFVYGRHAVLEMLLAGRRRVYRIHLAEGSSTSGIPGEIASRARLRGIRVTEVSRQALDAVGPVNHQGVVAEVDPYAYAELDDLLADNLPDDALLLVLDHLQDVQNMGTLLRTAEAMGVLGVILPDRRSAEITPAAVNASAGAVEHLRIAVVHNLAQTLDRCKAAGMWVAGLDAGPGAMPLARADLKGRIVLVVGAEGEGLARLVREKCDWLLTIPMYGKVASLNAAVAGSIALVAARQAQRGGEPARDGEAVI